MTMLVLIGVLFLALGLGSGIVLVLASVGMLAAEPGLTLWVTFPLLCLVGFGIVAAQARLETVRVVSLASSALLLLLALGSVSALVLGAAAVVQAPRSAASLWFVLIVGAALGSIGAASFGRRPMGTGPVVLR
jgi:hypothetical protein